MSQSGEIALVEAQSTIESNSLSQNSPEESEPGNAIQIAIDNFILSLEGVREIAPFFEVIADALAQKHRKDFESQRDRFGTIVSEADGQQQISFPLYQASRARDALRRLRNTKVAQRALPNMVLLALVSQYDAFITDLLKSLFQAKPELIFMSDKQIKFSDISQFSSLEEVKESIIEKEVEAIVRQSHAKQFDVMEKLFGVRLREGLDVWPDFIEITERRNLLAHTNGIVSRQYIAVCQSNGVPENELPSVGEQLSYPSGYLEHSYRVLFEISLKLSHVLWRKILPNDLRSSDAHYNDKCYQLIKSNQYDLSIKMLDFMCDVVKTHSEENLRLFLELNRCNAWRLAGDKKRSLALLNKIDTSALGLEYKLAEAILRDEFEQASILMKSIGAEHNVVNRFAYSDWPIFEQFRDSQHFLDAYEEVFGEPFTIAADEEGVEARDN